MLCHVCGVLIEGRRSQTKTCSNACRLRKHQQHMREYHKKANELLSAQTKAVIAQDPIRIDEIRRRADRFFRQHKNCRHNAG